MLFYHLCLKFPTFLGDFVVQFTKLKELTTIKEELVMKTYVAMSMLCLVSILTMNAFAEPAILFKGEFCVVVLPESEDEILEGNKLQVAVANAGQGDPVVGENLLPARYTCQGQHSKPLGHADVVRQPCFIPGTPFGDLFTENGRVIFTPAGNWTAVCKFDPVDQS